MRELIIFYFCLRCKGKSTSFQIDPSKVSEHNFELNSAISEDEVLKCLNHLKLNKACSSDLILNEFLKSSKTKMLTVFTTFFNLVFNTGIIPDEWSQGMISPIYKNKGDKASPDNYRGITILSCFGKLFTAILNTGFYRTQYPASYTHKPLGRTPQFT